VDYKEEKRKEQKNTKEKIKLKNYEEEDTEEVTHTVLEVKGQVMQLQVQTQIQKVLENQNVLERQVVIRKHTI
jgi:hypothetical protein